jgi:hypothetical protein
MVINRLSIVLVVVVAVTAVAEVLATGMGMVVEQRGRISCAARLATRTPPATTEATAGTWPRTTNT